MNVVDCLQIDQLIAYLRDTDMPCCAQTVQRLRVDAEWYHVLRNADIDAIRKGGLFAGMTPENLVINGEDLDRACDAIHAQRQMP